MRLLLLMGAVGTVDRIEGDFAVVEWRESVLTDVPVSALPPGVGEGDRIVLHTRLLRRRPATPDPR